MSTYRVFLGAPSAKDLTDDPSSYHWQTASSESADNQVVLPPPLDFPPVQTLDDASRRISLIYQNAIFNDDGEGVEHEDKDFIPQDQVVEQTTAITWPPTLEENQGDPRVQQSTDELSFLNITTRSGVESLPETQETQESQSLNYSDASIARFPTFHFNLHSIASLTQLSRQKFTGSLKLSILVAALEVEGPDIITIKKGRDAGKEVAILKMILGDEGGTICKLTAWREIAERWGGLRGSIAVKRGDILLIENVTANFDPTASPTITASPFLKSSITICYRTMPYTREDSRLRPDLRLGRSDASVRKVGALVAWFQHLAGLDGTDNR